MRTLLLNPPSYGDFDGGAGARYQARREIRSFWYPTWLAYPAGLIPDSRLLDAPPEGLEVGEVVHQAKGYELIVLNTSTPTVENDIRIAELLKEHYPGITVGFVGPHTMVLPMETLERSRAVDFVATGEFDYAVTEIAQGVPFEKVDGIAFRRGGTIRRTPGRPPLEDLDALPFVTDVYARDLTIERYYNGYLKHPYVSFYTGRGCRARCTYCLWPQTISGHAYRVRSVENVCAEMARAKSLFPGVKEFFLDDDTFTDNPPRAVEIARRFKKLGITWSCNARANVAREVLRELKEGGLRLLTVGIESGNQKILNTIKKGTRIEQIRTFVKEAKETGILLHAAFILGLPGETPETIEETIRFALELDPYSIQVSLVAPYPGTELYAQGIQEGWIVREGEGLVREGIQDAAISYRGLSREDIFEAVERFYRRFYLRPRPVLRILGEMLRDRNEFVRRIREGREFFSFMAKRKEVIEAS
ncbi:MAG: hopanoid biosynthesis associated radical SAM protein HpnJ [Alphaproteobacteria bacterium]|uniref:Hopanoid biosynthesis associated radical SAM protein HpnJ n=1 Tax=Candidatus Nitrobium versatile TaxID=2884831 RepID=A0A953SEQ9_9BACT|nr:hopanoid biosynthesis associated radical SAM protein HpnJ [Candidatus Nitrobium versatile]